MGKISEFLVEMLRRQVMDHGIIVWYDPQRAYTGLVQSLTLGDTAILRFEDGFFRLREKLESFLEYVTQEGGLKADADQPPSVLVYVPMAREESRYALIEAETAGVVLEPGAANAGCNTRLGSLVAGV